MYLSTVRDRHVEDISDSELRAIAGDVRTPDGDRRLIISELELRQSNRDHEARHTRVIVGGLDIPFGDLVMSMVKIALAAIPALLILVVIMGTIVAVLSPLGARK